MPCVAANDTPNSGENVMSSSEQRLQILEDRVQINELVSVYSLRILQNEAHTLPDLFTEDGIFQAGTLRLQGREQLTAMFGRMQAGITYPLVRPAEIKIEGDVATHVGVMQNPSGEGRAGYIGIYYDALRRVDGNWLFSKREFKFILGASPTS